MPVLRDVPAFDLAPDWVCEVISPSTGAIDRGRKMRIYAREGVAHLWIVDPLARTLEIYRLVRSEWVVAASYGGADTVRPEPFAAIAIDLDRWWLPE
jgi:Uma2 family endonuclease